MLLIVIKSASYFSPFYENTPIQIYIENFTTKNWKSSDKNSDIFSYLYLIFFIFLLKT